LAGIGWGSSTPSRYCNGRVVLLALAYTDRHAHDNSHNYKRYRDRDRQSLVCAVPRQKFRLGIIFWVVINRVYSEFLGRSIGWPGDGAEARWSRNRGCNSLGTRWRGIRSRTASFYKTDIISFLTVSLCDCWCPGGQRLIVPPRRSNGSPQFSRRHCSAFKADGYHQSAG